MGARIGRSLVEAMADAAVLLDLDLAPVYYNRPFAEATGLRPRRVPAELAQCDSVFDLLGNGERSDVKHVQEVLRTGTATHLGEMEVLNAAGDRFVMMQSFLPIGDGPDEPLGVIVVFRDLSDEARVHLRYKELLRLEQARAEELEHRVAERTQQLSEALEEVTRLSTHDPLTKLFNRRAFDEKARAAWDAAKDEGVPLALMLCDLDHFKRVNDEHGHQAGDKILVAVAEALVASVRPEDVVARFGGEEFVVLMAGSAASKVVLSVAERCGNAVRALPVPDLIPGANRRQTISIGAATYDSDCPSLDHLIAQADEALYEAKRTGRDRVILAGTQAAPTEELKEDAKPRLLLVDPDEARATATVARLSDRYMVVAAASGVEGLRCCARQPFDIILSEEDVGNENGITFLRKSFAFAPFSARVLILGNANAFVAIQATNIGRVDQLLLREDAESHLVEALEHARLKLDLVGPQTDREDSILAEQKLEGLQEIMRTGELRFAYQPIVHAPSGKIVGLEALARPHVTGFCSPRPNPIALLEVAARMGAQWELGRIGRKCIAREVETLRSQYLVFVNLHPTELANEQLLEEVGLVQQADRVVLEITERAAIRDSGRYADRIRRLRKIGFRMAVDDLRAGSAGLNAAAELNAEFVKLDMGLTRAINRWQIKQRLVSSVIRFARQQGTEVIAVGIETPDEAKTLLELGCSLQQGFLHGHPHDLPYWLNEGTFASTDIR